MVCIRTFVGMDNEVNNMCFSHNSKYLAYVDNRLGVAIVDVDTGEILFFQTIHRSTKEGQNLLIHVCVGIQLGVVIVDVDTGEHMQHLDLPVPFVFAVCTRRQPAGASPSCTWTPVSSHRTRSCCMQRNTTFSMPCRLCLTRGEGAGNLVSTYKAPIMSGVPLPAGRVLHTVHTGGHVPDALDWNPRHLVLAWPAALLADYRDAFRDSGPVAVFAPA